MRAPTVTLKRARTLRREALPEVVLWRALRRGAIAAFRFRRQQPIGPYVLDFYCAQARFAVEVDGAAHDLPQQAAHDARPETWLDEQGIACCASRPTTCSGTRRWTVFWTRS